MITPGTTQAPRKQEISISLLLAVLLRDLANLHLHLVPALSLAYSTQANLISISVAAHCFDLGH